MSDKIFALIRTLLDNDTLIIIFLFILALLWRTDVVVSAVVGGFLGYIKGGKNEIPGTS